MKKILLGISLISILGSVDGIASMNPDDIWNGLSPDKKSRIISAYMAFNNPMFVTMPQADNQLRADAHQTTRLNAAVSEAAGQTSLQDAIDKCYGEAFVLESLGPDMDAIVYIQHCKKQDY